MFCWFCFFVGALFDYQEVIGIFCWMDIGKRLVKTRISVGDLLAAGWIGMHLIIKGLLTY
jgi:hypothetical protein